MYAPPDDIIATRDFTVAGYTFSKGDSIPKFLWNGKGIDYLLSKRWVTPVPEIHGRTTSVVTPTPTYLAPAVKNQSLGEKLELNLATNFPAHKGFSASIVVKTETAAGWDSADEKTVLVDWGDGTSAETATFTGTSHTLTHSYPVVEGWYPGDALTPYVASFFVQGTGCYGTGTRSLNLPLITVSGTPGPLTLVQDAVVPLQANGTMAPYDPPADTCLVEWDWGDGSAIEVKEGVDAINATHVYAAAGDISVRADITHYPAADGDWLTGGSVATLTLTAPAEESAKAAPAKSRRHPSKASHDDDQA